MFNSIFGLSNTAPTTPTAQATHMANNPSSQASISMAQLANLAHNQFGSAYNAYAQQSMNQSLVAQQYQHAQQRYNQIFEPAPFRINGQDMDLEQFLNTLYPEDCAEKTYLALKLTKGNDQ